MLKRNSEEAPNVVWLAGGLGNQLFQVAFGIQMYYSGHNVIFDTGWFSTENEGTTKRNLEVDSVIGDIPRMDIPALQRQAFRDFGYYAFRISKGLIRTSSSYVQDAMFDQVKHKHPAYYQGYWQDRRFYEKSITEMQNRYLSKNHLNQGDHICMHIRRSDYSRPENAKVFHLLGTHYYKSAINNIQDKFGNSVKILVLSDDIQWATDLLAELNNEQLQLLHENHTGIELFKLMSCAKGLIIANSTFSFWAALLNPFQPYVIAPKSWYKNKKNDLPCEWKTL